MFFIGDIDKADVTYKLISTIIFQRVDCLKSEHLQNTEECQVLQKCLELIFEIKRRAEFDDYGKDD